MGSETRRHGRGSPVAYILVIVAIGAVVMLWVGTSYRSTAYTQGMHFGSAFGPLCSPALENYCLREYGNLDSFHRQVQRLVQLVSGAEEPVTAPDDPTKAADGNNSSTINEGRRRRLQLEGLGTEHSLEVQRAHLTDHHSSGCIERTADKRAELMMALGALRADMILLVKETDAAVQASGALEAQVAAYSGAKERADLAEQDAEQAREEMQKWRSEAETAVAALQTAQAEVERLKQETAGGGAAAAEVEALKKEVEEAKSKCPDRSAEVRALRKDLELARRTQCPPDQVAEVEILKAQLQLAKKAVCSKDQGGEVESLKQQAEEAKKQVEEAKKQVEEANKQVEEAKKQAEEAKAAAKQWEEKARGADTGQLALNNDVVLGVAVKLGDATQSMVVPRNDEGVGSWVVEHKAPVDGSALQKMLTYIKAGDVVVDVGANLGSYAIWFARTVGEAGKVWAFEPQPYIYQMLCTNVIVNGHRQVQTVNAALSFKRGMATLDAKVAAGTSAGRNFSDAAADLQGRVDFGSRGLGLGGERVPMLTLDSMRLSRVALLRVDVHGSEALVLWGAKDTIQRAQPVVSLRPGGALPEDVKKALEVPADVVGLEAAKWLEGLGYRRAETAEQEQFWVPKDWKP